MQNQISDFKKTGKQFFFVGKDSKSRIHGIFASYGSAKTASSDCIFAAICHNTVAGKSRRKMVYVADTQENLNIQLQAQVKKRRIEWKNMKFI